MGVKISGLTAKGATIADTDLVEVSQSAGGGLYTSRSVTGANIKALVTDANMTTSDITTNDVSTAKHGFAPKAPNDTAKFLRGDGTWAVPSAGGLTNFTEAETTAAPNGTVYVDSLTAAASTTNADAAIRPKGTGAFILAIPDNTTTGGNKRGANAVDLQTSRANANQVSSGASSFSAGANNRADGSYSTSTGQGCVSTGNWSLALQRANTASGDSSISLGFNCTSTSDRSIAIGESCTASAASTVSIGASNTSSAAYAVAIGYLNTSNQSNAIAIGRSNIANSQNGFAFGLQASVNSVIGRQSYASGQEGTPGDAQYSKFVLRNRTTDATTTIVSTDSATVAATTNQVILSNQSAYRFKGTIIGKQSGSTNTSAWDVDGLIVRGANAAATTLVVGNVNVVSNVPAWGTPALTADTTNGGLKVEVTGALATNIQWTAVIETTEVIYA